MALFGVVVMGKVIYAYIQGIPPEAITMGIIETFNGCFQRRKDYSRPPLE